MQIVDNFTWTLGEHAFKFGGEVRRVRYNQIGGVVTRGRFTYDNRYTRNPLLSANQGGVGMADFLLGHFNNAEGQVGAPIANFRSNYFALYFQDNWKVTPKLTLNWGLRWENDQPFKDKNDAIVNIDFAGPTPASRCSCAPGPAIPTRATPHSGWPQHQYVRDGRFGAAPTGAT